MNKFLLAFLLMITSVTAHAADHYVIKTGQQVQLLCQIFTEGKYFCKDLTSGKDAGSNVLILSEKELLTFGAEAFIPNQRALQILAN